MRKIILLILFLSFAVTLIAQEQDRSPLTSADYLAKAKKQNTWGWVLLGSGFSFATAGLIVEAKEVSEDALVTVFTLGTQEVKRTNTGEILLIIGGTAMLGSIPCFISSSKNKRRAASAPADIGFIMEQRPVLREAGLVQASFPAISLRIKL